MSHGPVDPTPQPTPQHVLTIARLSPWLGLGLWATALFAAYRWLDGPAAWALIAFGALYAFCVWLAARDTLARA